MKSWKTVLAVALSTLVAAGAWAQSYPTRTIKLVVPFSAGGSTDIIARLTAEQMRKELGQVVVVENVGGAAGALGTMQVVNATPDGYTLAHRHGEHDDRVPAQRAEARSTRSRTSCRSPTSPRCRTSSRSTPTFPAKNLTEFIAVLKASPGKYSYATSGVGSINHMLGESFQA